MWRSRWTQMQREGWSISGCHVWPWTEQLVRWCVGVGLCQMCQVRCTKGNPANRVYEQAEQWVYGVLLRVFLIVPCKTILIGQVGWFRTGKQKCEVLMYEKNVCAYRSLLQRLCLCQRLLEFRNSGLNPTLSAEPVVRGSPAIQDRS